MGIFILFLQQNKEILQWKTTQDSRARVGTLRCSQNVPLAGAPIRRQHHVDPALYLLVGIKPEAYEDALNEMTERRLT